jgi:hypothetical protein
VVYQLMEGKVLGQWIYPADPTDRFAATMSGTEVTFDPVIPDDRCVEMADMADAVATFVGHGEVTDLGPVDIVAEHCSDFDTGTYGDGRLTITAANGDILRGTYAHGVSTAPPPLSGFRDDFAFVDGGTGRFVFARGSGAEAGHFNQDTNEWSLRMTGAISYSGGPPPMATADEALVADLAAVMSEPYDATTVAALYAPDAVIHETTANMTQRGLDEIGARIREFDAAGFEAVPTSAPIRQDDFVAAFHKYGTGGDLSGRALVVYQLMEGKVLGQWIYPAG